MCGVIVDTLLKSRDGTDYQVSEANSNKLMLSENRNSPLISPPFDQIILSIFWQISLSVTVSGFYMRQFYLQGNSHLNDQKETTAAQTVQHPD